MMRVLKIMYLILTHLCEPSMTDQTIGEDMFNRSNKKEILR